MTFASIYRSILGRRTITSRSVPVVNQFDLIAISSDTCFFASLVHATTPYGWTIRWARSISGAVDMLAERPAPIIVYDCGPVAGDWTGSIARLRSDSEDPCIVMAVGLLSEELWQDALSRKVYDVVSRVGHGSQLVATLQFAKKWRADRRSNDMRLPGMRKEYTTHSSEAHVCR